MKKINDYSSYGNNYSESDLWEKIKKVAQKAGVKWCTLFCCFIM